MNTDQPIIFKVHRASMGEPKVIRNPYGDMVGMDAYGNYYCWGTNEWYPLYNWCLAEKGIHDGWTEEINEGYGRQYLVFRGAFFYLTSHWNNAADVGFKWRPWQYTTFKRTYHLLFGKHYEESKVEYPALVEYVKDQSKK